LFIKLKDKKPVSAYTRFFFFVKMAWWWSVDWNMWPR